MKKKKKKWVNPVLTILVRTNPEDGVLQQQSCKFFTLPGPGGEVCGLPESEGCLGIYAS
jgi:hypothetical protein